MTQLLLKFLLAHMIGDFLLQPSKWVEDKKLKKHKSKYLYLHIGVHFLLMFILCGFSVKYSAGILCIGVSHLIIDWIKLYMEAKTNPRVLFFADQILHLAIILLVTYTYFPRNFDFSSLGKTSVLLLELFLLITTFVSAIVMKVIISKWNIENDSDESLNQAGTYIGILERLFVFVFIITHHWEGIGFLLAAKSIFRFGDLSNAKDRKLTEYVLIGTLISFGLAILSGMCYEYCLPFIKK